MQSNLKFIINRRSTAVLTLLAAALVPLGKSLPAQQGLTAGEAKLPLNIISFTELNRIAYAGPGLEQSYAYSVGSRIIRKIKRERLDPSRSWSVMRGEEGATFTVTGLATRNGGDELYLAGQKDDGSCVIELWKYSARKGGWKSETELASNYTLGVPAPRAAQITSVEGGGAWRPVQRAEEVIPPARKSVVYSSPDGPLHGLSVDPQGRYLITFDMTRKELIQIDLKSSPIAAAVIADVSTIPNMQEAGVIQIMDFTPEQGRRVLIKPQQGYATTPVLYWIGVDVHNDGLFETFTELDAPGWAASVYTDYDLWDYFNGID